MMVIVDDDTAVDSIFPDVVSSYPCNHDFPSYDY